MNMKEQLLALREKALETAKGMSGEDKILTEQFLIEAKKRLNGIFNQNQTAASIKTEFMPLDDADLDLMMQMGVNKVNRQYLQLLCEQEGITLTVRDRDGSYCPEYIFGINFVDNKEIGTDLPEGSLSEALFGKSN